MAMCHGRWTPWTRTPHLANNLVGGIPMDRIGANGVMAARAQAVTRDDPAFAHVLVEERKTGLFFFQRVQPEARPAWEAYYTLWARIVPDDPERSLYRLEYMRYTNRW